MFTYLYFYAVTVVKV